MQSICEYCNSKKEHLYLMTLPCGYVVCYDHLKPSIQHVKDPFSSFNRSRTETKCLVCPDHYFNIEKCLEMAKNKSKFMEIGFIEHLKLVKEKIKSIENYIEDTDFFLDKYLAPVVNMIDLRREQLKKETNKKIDDAYFKTINEIDNIRSNFKQKAKSIDNKQFEELAKYEKNNGVKKTAEYFNDKLKELKSFEKDSIESLNKMIENFKTISFEYSASGLDSSKRYFRQASLDNEEYILGQKNRKIRERSVDVENHINFCFGKINYQSIN
ncbi:unnamed protein product [Brachionus calyciflorus]|uniref:Uncharacterized protein n=1 Tax=Brachionus calyciflorus TaxID=104777 RepID=A0A814QTC6_9BILA|nr:unnamed protein product [Brachionus calyciflorus]